MILETEPKGSEIIYAGNYKINLSRITYSLQYFLTGPSAKEVNQGNIELCSPNETKFVYGIGPCVGLALLSEGNKYPLIAHLDPKQFNKPIPIIDSAPFGVIGGGYKHLVEYHPNIKNFIVKPERPFQLALTNHGNYELTILFGKC